MSKKNRNRKRQGSPLPRRITMAQAQEIAATRAGNAAIELIIAGSQVLKAEHGFTPEQINEWQKKTIAQGKANRETVDVEAD